MRVQRPVFTDFAFQSELFTVGGQQQFNGGGIKADTVVKLTEPDVPRRCL